MKRYTVKSVPDLIVLSVSLLLNVFQCFSVLRSLLPSFHAPQLPFFFFPFFAFFLFFASLLSPISWFLFFLLVKSLFMRESPGFIKIQERPTPTTPHCSAWRWGVCVGVRLRALGPRGKLRTTQNGRTKHAVKSTRLAFLQVLARTCVCTFRCAT